MQIGEPNRSKRDYAERRSSIPSYPVFILSILVTPRFYFSFTAITSTSINAHGAASAATCIADRATLFG